jgi:hypothetical protein
MSDRFEGAQLELELLDPSSVELVRLFRHPGGDWDPPPAAYRNQRVDPPVGKESDYAVLYTGDCIEAVAVECRILACDSRDRYTYDIARTREYSVVRYEMLAPAIFIPLDGNRKVLGLRGFDPDYERHRSVAHELFTRYRGVVHGLSWDSYHRNQPGRVYALWHDHKDSVELVIKSSKPYSLLAEDPDWLKFLASRPDIDGLGS